jgi:hypothetical protein
VAEGNFWLIRSKTNAEMLHEFLLRSLDEGKETLLKEEQGNRTSLQNNALHGLLRRMSAALNDAGIEGPAHPWREDLRLDWSPELCKSMLFHPVMHAMTGKQSSSKLTKQELSEAVEQMLRRVTEVTGVYVEGLDFRNGQ